MTSFVVNMLDFVLKMMKFGGQSHPRQAAGRAAGRSGRWSATYLTALGPKYAACILCPTGGFTGAEQINAALASGMCEMVGMGRAFVVEAGDDVAAKLDLATEQALAKIKASVDLSAIQWIYYQFRRIGRGLPIDFGVSFEDGIREQEAYNAEWGGKYRRTITNTKGPPRFAIAVGALIMLLPQSQQIQWRQRSSELVMM